VRSIFNTHVFDAAPDVAARKASEVKVDDFVRLIGKLTEAGKGRTAAKLRSYLRAAYSLAIASKTDPDAPMTLQAFGIEANPVASVGARRLSKYNRTRNRVLDASEMGAFLRRVDALHDSVQKDVLKLLLFLGGQRPMQLLHVTAADIDHQAGTVTLYDGKGAHGTSPTCLAVSKARGRDSGTALKGSRWGTTLQHRRSHHRPSRNHPCVSEQNFRGNVESKRVA